MPSDREIGEFLEEHLQFAWIPNSYAYLCEDWLWTGRIIEAMRERGFGLYVAECDKYLSFEKNMGEYVAGHTDAWAVEGILEPRTVAIAAAKALGMEVSDD